ncbi:MAG: TauD/TfdA family dioxygenase [Minwuia sp.]|nr:TauD/TfdA family dioxygenase [Minwuia sp.]
MSEPLVVRRVAGALGAEVSGVDLSRDLATDTIAALRQALLDHLVIFLRDQPIEPARFLAFARAFGTPVEYPFVKGLDAFPQIIEVAKLEEETTNFGGIWHSDTVYLDEPPMGSMLLAREIPPQGGDTLFANQYLAYEALSPTFQGLLDGLTAIHSSAKADVSKTREDRIRSGGTAEAGKDYLSYHPAVRTHPETGRKALFVNVAHTVRFDGMTEAESKPILDYLFQHQIRPEFTCRFTWSPGAIAFWDNRCAQHNPVNDYHGYRRIMHRITLAGDRPA